MAHLAATMNSIKELVKITEYSVRKRNRLQSSIEKDEEEKLRVEKEMERLPAKLVKLEQSLAQKVQSREFYDKVAESVESSNKMMDSIQPLIHSVRQRDSFSDEDILDEPVTLSTPGGSALSGEAETPDPGQPGPSKK